MSFEITEAFVKQFSSNVFHLSQQKGSRLRGAVRNETQVGKSAFYDRIGSVAAQKRTSRHGDTPQLDTPHSRRRVDLEDYEWADLVDDQDKIRMLMDPTSMYAQAAAWALGRSMDVEILRALNGTAITTDDTGSPNVDLSSADDSPDKLIATDGTAFSSLNVLTLRRLKRKLDEQEADPSISRYIAVNAKMLESLLSETETTSSDFNSVKALVQGEMNSFMGFNFIRTELLQTASAADASQSVADVGNLDYNLSSGEVENGSGSSIAAADRVGFAWAQNGLLLSTGQDIVGEIARRPDKSFSTQVYAKMTIGGVRMEEAKVIKFFVNE